MIRLLITIISLFLSTSVNALSYTHEIAEQELQVKVSEMMPLEKKKFFITVILSDPKVELIDGKDRVRVFSNIAVKAPKGISGNGQAQITGSLSYDSNNGSFHLHDTEIESLKVDKLSEQHLLKVKKVAEFVVSKFLSVRPVYKFKDDNLKHKLAKSVLESISIKDKILFLELSLL